MATGNGWQSVWSRHLSPERTFSTISGRLFVRAGRESAAHGRLRAFDFWYATPSKWRIEVDGQLEYVNNGTRAYQRTGDDEYHAVRQAALPEVGDVGFSPARLIGGTASILGATSTDVAITAADVTVLRGRETLPVVASSGAAQLHIAFDTETAVISSVQMPELDLEAWIEQLEIDRVFDHGIFEFPADGKRPSKRPVRTINLRHVEEMDFYTPRYWPTGIGHSPFSADASTGEVGTTLEVKGFPILIRWRLGTLALSEKPEWIREYPHRYDWSDTQWHWRLLSRVAISDADLDRIRDSYP